MSKQAIDRPRHLVEIECLDKDARIADLPASAAAHEAPQLILLALLLPGRLLLERPEGSKIPAPFAVPRFLFTETLAKRRSCRRKR